MRKENGEDMKKITKVIALALVIVLVLGVSGCGKGNDPKNVTGVSGSGNEAKAGSSENSKETAKKVKLTLGVRSVSPQTDPCNWYETDVWKYILNYVKENYGYDITPEWVLYDMETVNLMLVSGELPDIVFIDGQEVANTLVKSDYIVDLNDYKSVSPNIFSKTYEQRNDLIMSLTGEGNKLYFLPIGLGAENVDGGIEPGRGYTVNWEWYKELGCPEIKSDDDYIDVLSAMVAKHPTNKDGNKVFAYGLRGDYFKYWYQRSAFTYPALVNFWTYDGFLYMDGYDDNVLYDGYTNTTRSSYWQDMEFCWKLNQRGVFDIDSFTQTGDELKAKMKAGRYAGAYRPLSELYSGSKADDPNTLMGYVTVPSTNSMLFGNKLHLAGYYPDNYCAVAKRDSKKKDVEAAAVALMDACHNLDIQRMVYCGFEGKQWNYVNGVPTLTDEFKQQVASDDKALLKLGIAVNNFQFCQGSTLCDDGYPIELSMMDVADSMNVLQKDVAAYYGVKVPALAQKKLVDEGKIIDHTVNYSETVAIAREELPSDISRILTKCNDLYYNNMSKLITAATWDEFKAIQKDMIETVKKYGEDEAWNWCRQNHENARSIIKPIYEEYLKNYMQK